MSIDPNTPSQQQNPDSPMPGQPEPLSPGRVDVDPDDEAGVDELPDNDGNVPLNDEDSDEDLDPERVREETDNAERDEQTNPR